MDRYAHTCRYDARTAGLSTQTEWVMEERKRAGTRGRNREVGCFNATRLFLLLKIIPCSLAATHTQTPPPPSVLSTSVSLNETSLYVMCRRVERAGWGWGAKVCEEATALEMGMRVRRWSKCRCLSGGKDFERWDLLLLVLSVCDDIADVLVVHIASHIRGESSPQVGHLQRKITV